MAASTTEKEVHGLVKNMLYRIANSDAVVKSQQRGEPDLTVDEKVTILLGILDRSPGSFLMRFGKYLVEDDLRNFDHLEGDYEIDFRLKEVKKILDTKKKNTGVRNRRFECLQRLMKDSDYFSEEQMRKRSPLLYEEYIGQYLSEEEKFERDKAEMGNDPTLSELLMSRQEKQMDDWYLEYQRDQQTSIEEENESDSDSSLEKGDCSVLICVVCYVILVINIIEKSLSFNTSLLRELRFHFSKYSVTNVDLLGQMQLLTANLFLLPVASLVCLAVNCHAQNEGFTWFLLV